MSNDGDETGLPIFYNHRHLFSVVVFSFTTLVGVPGNALVLWVTGVKMKWTMTTIWFWNLAVADIMCCLCLPLIVVQYFYTNWLYGAALCKIIPFIAPLNMFTSVFTLVAISVDRCILVVQPIWARNHRGVGKAWVTCLAIWMMSFIICIPKFLYRSFSNSNNTARCDSEGNILEPTTYIYMVFGFLLPFFIISACYISVAFILRKKRFTKVGNKIIKVSIGIVVAFFITWAPYHIMGVVLLYTNNKVVDVFDLLSQSLPLFNSCINPILYVFMGKDMKGRVQQSVRRVMQNALSEELSRSTERTRSRLTAEDSQAL